MFELSPIRAIFIQHYVLENNFKKHNLQNYDCCDGRCRLARDTINRERLTSELAAAVAAVLLCSSPCCCNRCVVVCRRCDCGVAAVVADNRCRKSGGRQAASSSPPSDPYFRVKPPYCLAIDGVCSPVLLTRLEPANATQSMKRARQSSNNIITCNRIFDGML
jgi:hypothetical protein